MSLDTEDYWTALAIQEVANTYGDSVSVDKKKKSLLKFGENPAVGTAEATLMEFLGSETSETYATGNDIDGLVFDDTFTGAVTIEGHTISGSDLTFVSQTINATSTTKATLTTPLYRATRIFNASGTNMPANSKGYVYASSGVSLIDGVPQTASSVKIIMSAAEQQSLKAATSLSSQDYAFVTEIYASINKKTQGGAVIRFKVRDSGGVFRTVFKRGINSLGPDLNFKVRPYKIIPKNADIIITAEADSAAAVSGGFNSILAIIQ